MLKQRIMITVTVRESQITNTIYIKLNPINGVCTAAIYKKK